MRINPSEISPDTTVSLHFMELSVFQLVDLQLHCLINFRKSYRVIFSGSCFQSEKQAFKKQYHIDTANRKKKKPLQSLFKTRLYYIIRPCCINIEIVVAFKLAAAVETISVWIKKSETAGCWYTLDTNSVSGELACYPKSRTGLTFIQAFFGTLFG